MVVAGGAGPSSYRDGGGRDFGRGKFWERISFFRLVPKFSLEKFSAIRAIFAPWAGDLHFSSVGRYWCVCIACQHQSLCWCVSVQVCILCIPKDDFVYPVRIAELFFVYPLVPKSPPPITWGERKGILWFSTAPCVPHKSVWSGSGSGRRRPLSGVMTRGSRSQQGVLHVQVQRVEGRLRWRGGALGPSLPRPWPQVHPEHLQRHQVLQPHAEGDHGHGPVHAH